MELCFKRERQRERESLVEIEVLGGVQTLNEIKGPRDISKGTVEPVSIRWSEDL